MSKSYKLIERAQAAIDDIITSDLPEQEKNKLLHTLHLRICRALKVEPAFTPRMQNPATYQQKGIGV